MCLLRRARILGPTHRGRLTHNHMHRGIHQWWPPPWLKQFPVPPRLQSSSRAKPLSCNTVHPVMHRCSMLPG